MCDVVTIQDFKLMVKYDMNIIQDEADRLTFLASMYRRAGVLKSNYPEDLFDEGTTTMIKSDKIWLQLTRNEANAIMVMLDGEMENTHDVAGIDLSDWENLDLEAYKLLAFHKFKTWYMENCDG